jgi:hypothetical protein
VLCQTGLVLPGFVEDERGRVVMVLVEPVLAPSINQKQYRDPLAIGGFAFPCGPTPVVLPHPWWYSHSRDVWSRRANRIRPQIYVVFYPPSRINTLPCSERTPSRRADRQVLPGARSRCKPAMPSSQPVRHPTPDLCAGLMSPEPLAGKPPVFNRRSWELTITPKEAIWRQIPFGESFALSIASITRTD